ncbi:MAG: alcohol dehydrogenase catalytic domain-containing protein [Bacteroidales bacterium]|nr:alcohol dehydrogenase catalytic domain-containing protein [Bacteroidales bacterium]
MKAMMLTGIRQMEMMDIPAPLIQKTTDVLIKMKSVGVCGSDIHYYTDGKIGCQVVTFPFPLGHEGAGIVEEVGRGVTLVKPGDRIAIDPAMPCWECDQCKAGRSHTCRNLRFLGNPGQADGCLTEYIVMPETSCFPIDKDLNYNQAAISEPLSIGVYSVKNSKNLQGASIGILGFGPIGMSVLLAARVHNPSKIFVTDKIPERLEMAKRCGAQWTGNPETEDIVKGISEKEPLSLDVVFECCGQQDALENALDILKPGGKLMIVGIPPFDTWQVNVDKTRHKEITIQFVRRQLDCVQTALDFIKQGKTDVSKMPTHWFKFSETNKAFDLVANYRDGVMKAMIDFD